MKHYSVLLQETVDGLHIKENGIYVDGTLGRGGHSAEILKQIPNGHLYSVDRDIQAIEESKDRLLAIGKNITFLHTSFAHLKEALLQEGIYEIDGLLLDLGVSSPQFDEASRGFSYRYDAPLDMRMDQSQERSAWDVVNTYDYQQLVRIFYQYGEEKFSKQIARKIEKQREIKTIDTTFELVDIIKSSLPAKVLNSKGHPAKKIFQAIRIEVNDELQELRKVLEDGMNLLKPQGRISVITFQSLEDRIVKEMFVKASSVEKIDKRIPVLPQDIKSADFKLITKKPIVATQEELEENNRSHSAKLRIIEKVR